MSTDPIDRLTPRPLPGLDVHDIDMDDDGRPDVADVETRPAAPGHGPLRLLNLGGTSGAVRYRTLAPVQFWQFGQDLPRPLQSFMVPAGFVFDKATIPLTLRAVGAVAGLDRDHLDAAALAHDYALAHRALWAVSREACDRLFLAVALAEPHLPDWLAKAAYHAVRANSLATGTPAGRAARAVASHALRGLLPFLPRR